MPKNDSKPLLEKFSSIGDGKIGWDIYHLIKSRHKTLYIRSCEESRVMDCLKIISASEGYDLFQWDYHRGLMEVVQDSDSFKLRAVKVTGNEVNEFPDALLSYILSQAKVDNQKMAQIKKGDTSILTEGHIYALLDFHLALRGEATPQMQRKIKELSELSSVCCVVIIAPTFECPLALDKIFTLLDFPYPSKEELRQKFSLICNEIPVHYPQALKAAKEREEDILSAAKGLTIDEAENSFALSLVKCKTFDIQTILDEKKQIIRKSGILEFINSTVTFDDIGGLHTLKDWLRLRRLGFSEKARQFGLKEPSGTLLCGCPGTGKSLTAAALANFWELPLLRLDMGSVFGSYIGSSEQNIRNVIKIAEAVSPCILWLEEVEKALGGVRSSNMTDGGVTNRVFGTLLTWMQEKTVPVFVVCTANNVLDLPPEFMRAGRFDEVFFLDLPDESQRCEVIERLLLRKRRNPDEFDIQKIAKASDFYSPAEIEKGINNGMFVAYADGSRQVSTDDVINELRKFQPLYNSRKEEIIAMRAWAMGEDGQGGRAVLANAVAEDWQPVKSRTLNLDV